MALNNKSSALLAILLIIIIIVIIAVYWSHNCEPCEKKDCRSQCKSENKCNSSRSVARCALSPESCASSNSSSSPKSGCLVDDAWAQHQENMKKSGMKSH